MKWPVKDASDTQLQVRVGGSINLKEGITLQCGDTRCKFKIQCYRFGELREAPASPQQVELKVLETVAD